MKRFITWLAGVSCLALTSPAAGLPPVRTVFIIMMENASWDDVKGNPSAPFLNSLLPAASYCEQYYNPPGISPSEPNYLWLLAGTNFGIFDDGDPSLHSIDSTQHLDTLLNHAGISWKAYVEDIAGDTVPLVSEGEYAAKHNPFVFFDDVTGTNDPNYAYGIAHIRPYPELMGDLASNTVAQYNFITPDLCDDMHDTCAPLSNNLLQGDMWLSTEIPKITNSAAYQNGAAIFITWDESDGDFGPIGMIVLSPLARGGGYYNNITYTHSSTLRTIQEFFGVQPFLGDAANVTDLSDLFSRFDVTNCLANLDGTLQISVGGVIPGATNLVQVSTDLVDWATIGTNVCMTNTFTYVDAAASNRPQSFYRAVQLPFTRDFSSP